MSADALPGGVRRVAPEPPLLNRMLAVLAAIFAVPVVIELVASHGGPLDGVLAPVTLAAGALALSASVLVRRFGAGSREFRTARCLTAVLVVQAAILTIGTVLRQLA
jgi:hypothetical protein